MYFELDDIKRRHSPYWDVYNSFGYAPAPDNQLTWNYQRGAIAGIIGAALNETQVLFTENWRLLLKNYEWPANLKQYSIFFRETLRMDNFRKGIKNRLQYALVFGGVDISSRLASWRWINSGWHSTWGSCIATIYSLNVIVEANYLRKILPTITLSALTCWIGVPFEMAKMAYYADKTFPQEYQRGYTSYFNALRRIPFEEGPYFLYKNTFPLLSRNFFQTLTLFYTYDWLKDKLGGVTYRLTDWPYGLFKWMAITFSTYLACVFSYPFGVMSRQLVDFWPKEKGGVCTFQGNYRKAMTWLWYHDYSSNYFPGFINNYFWRQAPWMFTSLWIADTMGMFTPWRVDPYSGPGNNTWEDVFS